MTRENRKIIQGLFKKSLRERVKTDIYLHNCTIKGYKTDIRRLNLTIKKYRKSIEYYLDANAEKYVLLDILNGKITDSRRIRKTIVDLKKARRTHLYKGSGDQDWDKAWVRVYDEWIAHLNGMLDQ